MKLHPYLAHLRPAFSLKPRKTKKRHRIMQGALAVASLACLLNAPYALGQAGCTPDPYAANSYWWTGYYGNRAAIDFRSGTAVAVTTVIGQGNNTLGFEGTASIVNPINNQLLFVTDGNRVYRGGDGALAPGVIGGNPSGVEPAAIIPQPGGTVGTQFIVFGNTAYDNVQGDLNTTGYNLTTNSIAGVSASLTGIGDGIEVIPHVNGVDYWIIVQKNGRLQSHLFSSSGFNSTPASILVIGGSPQGFGSFSWSPLNNKLLIANNAAIAGNIGTANIDRSTGKLSNYEEHINPYSGVYTGYAPALSPNGRYIFFSDGGSPSANGAGGVPKVWDIVQGGVVRTLSGSGRGGVKVGPDNRVYWAGATQSTFLWLSNPDNPTAGAEGTINLGAGHLSGYNLPNNTYFACETLIPCTNPSPITVTSSSGGTVAPISAGSTASYTMTGGDVSGSTPTYTWTITPSLGVTPSSGTGKTTGTVTFAHPGNYQVVFTATNSSIPTGCAVGTAGSSAGGVTTSTIVQEVWSEGADLAITKTASATNVVSGQAFAYTLTATNNGPGAATNVVVKDTVPAGVTITGTPSASGGGVVSVSGQTVTVTWPTLANGASQTVTINVTKN